ncbi:MAG: putative glycerol-1-phosphate prenyltransferase [Flammeovirgaceae bacterium]|jgi:phosphoglycerol geranylgeranyltransferase
MSKSVHKILQHSKNVGKKSFAILIDPDKADGQFCEYLLELAKNTPPDFFFIGGSLITSGKLETVISLIKTNTDIPIVIFPGSNLHISEQADGILFLSLISGRNPEYLIGQHVIAAPILKQSKLEVISTGYMLVNCGNQTTVSYISNTTPIPYDKPEIAAATAMAGEMLGLKVIFMDGGSGALKPISQETIHAVSKYVELPIIVGGGIRNYEQAKQAFSAGADLIVVGTAIEQNPELLTEIYEATQAANLK